mmetsp:Transcript_57867/g.164411  ORF Transcript_57867/g.164411 Transcript_57867/m.164411 type:complete len:131 (-) Transcript_57867:186-578(-)
MAPTMQSPVGTAKVSACRVGTSCKRSSPCLHVECLAVVEWPNARHENAEDIVHLKIVNRRPVLLAIFNASHTRQLSKPANWFSTYDWACDGVFGKEVRHSTQVFHVRMRKNDQVQLAEMWNQWGQQLWLH